MKKILLELIHKYFQTISEVWFEKIRVSFGDKLNDAQIKTLVGSTLQTIINVIKTSDYKNADQYLIDNYNLFSETKLNLLEISQLFSNGRYAIVNHIEKEISDNYDPLILLGFIDEIIEQIYARYGMLHQEAQMTELTIDRDRLAAKLETNQKYLKNIMHSTDSAIMVIDENEKIIAWNKGAERIFGYSEDEVIGRESSLLIPQKPEQSLELRDIKENVAKIGFVNIPETVRIAKSGKEIPVQLNVTALPGKNKSYSGRSVIIKDVSEVKKLQEQVDQSEKLAVIGQLAAGVAHEIGNPLASISSLVQILQRKSSDDFTIESLSSIKENIDRITKIVRELVDFSRPPSYEKKLIQITDVLKTALGIVKYDKRVRKVDFATTFDPDLPFIYVVPDQLLQVFINILINALDAIDGEGRIAVSSCHDSKYIYIEIEDDGVGMTIDVINKIFDPFFTTKGVGKGTGLGLSVSYGIVKKLQGEIHIKSELNKGSKFMIQLPIDENKIMEF
ncbi:MAG: PAS domain S-box protein [Melioribacteraceae bacterium]|nr:PAS domain S-box protein [Melioribacteraceae bacterium]MCF8263297.1 PAS domain S-box protein [Melioribacteraceae bacterium]MCF8413988.1 PAS domain S-box protein [Melioribacteraceae bacterium]MCF8431175.1 PAS domain S-box protein [Melioribacteraceae bacterium]